MTREEAIQTICNIYQTDKEKLALEFLIPELKTYKEDAIKRDITYAIKCCYTDERAQPMFDWLKEQKEQKPTISDDAIREGVAHFGITQYQIDNWLKKHINVIEQKPNEEEIRKIRLEEYTKGFNDAVFGSKQEWSEEDKGLLLSTKCIIDEVWHSENTFGYSKEELEEIWNWLNVAWTRLEYPKENDEWSEDDLNRIRNLIFLVENSNEGSETKKNFVKFLQRLYIKSQIKKI